MRKHVTQQHWRTYMRLYCTEGNDLVGLSIAEQRFEYDKAEARNRNQERLYHPTGALREAAWLESNQSIEAQQAERSQGSPNHVLRQRSKLSCPYSP